MAEEELKELVVSDNSSMCKADFAGDGVPPTVHPSTVEKSNMSIIIIEINQKDMLTKNYWSFNFWVLQDFTRNQSSKDWQIDSFLLTRR